MFTPIQMRINRKRLAGDERDRTVEARNGLTLSWGAEGGNGVRQTAFRARFLSENTCLFDTGWRETDKQECGIAADGFPRAKRILIKLQIRDDTGAESAEKEASFYIGDTDWTAAWIRPQEDDEGRAVYFRRDFTVTEPVRSATLYACGLGYHRLYLNGELADAAHLDPAHTDYSRVCQYVCIPGAERLLKPGENCLSAVVGGGWRDNKGRYLHSVKREISFFGPRQFSCMLDIETVSGKRERIITDESWQAGFGAHAVNSLFDGETYDANLRVPGWNQPGFTGFSPARRAPAPEGDMRLMEIPPVREMGVFRPVSISRAPNGTQILDFGINLAGVVRLKLPKLPKGATIVLRHAEELDEDGSLFTGILRGAKAEDRYIASGDGRDLAVWQPEFTYHGFRYASVEGLEIGMSDAEAVLLHTDLENESRFTCGSAAINALQSQILTTERDNMHSILTDCPQRDERMGWMNDATVRFEETPYNFDCAVMFRKIVRDLMSAQRADGAISCTCPFVYGNYPADPVSSSFLVAVRENYMHFGDAETLREAFSALCAWEDCLLNHSDGFIVNYSYYGDWAGPVYACEGDPVDGARSAVTPGTFMSTGFSFFNCKTLSQMALALSDSENAQKYAALAGEISEAMRKKWYHPEDASFATGSMGAQAFSLWLGIVPESDRLRAARKMRDDLARENYAFTTGNLTTRYLLDMLAEYGYEDDAYELLTRDEYPSWGFMRQNEATTVWERFELKKTTGMNSHNHPMYGAAGAFLYRYLAGVRPIEPGYTRFEVKPRMPKKLLSAQANLDTPSGRVNVRWVKRYGQAILFVDVPFGAVCEAEFMGRKYVWETGSHTAYAPL